VAIELLESKEADHAQDVLSKIADSAQETINESVEEALKKTRRRIVQRSEKF
jgi:hypothetical protein